MARRKLGVRCLLGLIPRRMRRPGGHLIYVVLLCLVLSACNLETGDALLRLPNPPIVFDGLQKKVDAHIAEGAEYAPPVSGNNRQVFQTMDLNADGLEEVLVFMRVPGEQSLRIYIYQLTGEEYVEIGVISDDAETIELVRYSDLNGDGCTELLVGWQVGSTLKVLSAYSFAENEYEEILNTDYSYISLLDMRGTGQNDVLVLRHDPKELVGSAELFFFEENILSKTPQIRLSKNILRIIRTQNGTLDDGYMALYVASEMEQNALVTDVLTYRDGQFFNVSLNPESEISEETIRYKRVFAADLNSDGIICLPRLTPLPGYAAASDNNEFWLTEWRHYDSHGRVSQLMTTYYNTTDGWYIKLTEEWLGRFTVTSRQTINSMRVTTLAYIADEDSPPVDMCEIYVITGSNRTTLANLDDRFTLSVKQDSVIAAKLLPGAYGRTPLSLTKETLLEMFKLIETKWITGELDV